MKRYSLASWGINVITLLANSENVALLRMNVRIKYLTIVKLRFAMDSGKWVQFEIRDIFLYNIG